MAQTPSSVTPTATKIMLIRHAEKPPSNPPPHGVDSKGDHDKESLVVEGWQRAGALVVFFAPSVGAFQQAEIATPTTIYASEETSGSESKRPQETVKPLVDKLGGNVTTNFSFPKGQEPAVAQSAMGCSGVVLICWEHQNIPLITQGFPISPNSNPVPTEWPSVPGGSGGRYDVVWVFDLDSPASGYCFYEEPQLLLAGDGPI